MWAECIWTKGKTLLTNSHDSDTRGNDMRAYLLNIAHNGTFWHVANRLHIANGQGCLLATVDELHKKSTRRHGCMQAL